MVSSNDPSHKGVCVGLCWWSNQSWLTGDHTWKVGSFQFKEVPNLIFNRFKTSKWMRNIWLHSFISHSMEVCGVCWTTECTITKDYTKGSSTRSAGVFGWLAYNHKKKRYCTTKMRSLFNKPFQWVLTELWWTLSESLIVKTQKGIKQ